MKRNVKVKEKISKDVSMEVPKSEAPSTKPSTPIPPAIPQAPAKESKSEDSGKKKDVPLFNMMKGLEKECTPRLIKDIGVQKSFMLKANRASIFGYIQWNLAFPVPRNILTYIKTGIKADSPALLKSIFTLTSNPERLYKDGLQVDPTPIIVDGELTITLWSTTSNFRIAQGMDVAIINVM